MLLSGAVEAVNAAAVIFFMAAFALFLSRHKPIATYCTFAVCPGRVRQLGLAADGSGEENLGTEIRGQDRRTRGGNWDPHQGTQCRFHFFTLRRLKTTMQFLAHSTGGKRGRKMTLNRSPGTDEVGE